MFLPALQWAMSQSSLCSTVSCKWPFSVSSVLIAKLKTHNFYVEMKTSGTMVTVMQSCSKCWNEYVWKSQPLVLGKYPAANILLSFAVLVSGASISKILLVFHHLGLCVYSSRTFFRHHAKAVCFSNNTSSLGILSHKTPWKVKTP